MTNPTLSINNATINRFIFELFTLFRIFKQINANIVANTALYVKNKYGDLENCISIFKSNEANGKNLPLLGVYPFHMAFLSYISSHIQISSKLKEYLLNDIKIILQNPIKSKNIRKLLSCCCPPPIYYHHPLLLFIRLLLYIVQRKHFYHLLLL